MQRPANEDITIPDHLQAIRDKETVGTQQVCFLVDGKWCLVYVLLLHWQMGTAYSVHAAYRFLRCKVC